MASKLEMEKNLRVVRNYLDDTSILLFTYRKAKACLHDGLKNVTVYGNHIVPRNTDTRAAAYRLNIVISINYYFAGIYQRTES